MELEEKTRLINQVLELQHTLEGNKYIHTYTIHTHRTLFSPWVRIEHHIGSDFFNSVF